MDETSRVEAMLEPLIRAHGIKKVMADLEQLIPRSKWQQWQRVANLAQNVNRRLNRQNLTKEKAA